MDRPQKAGEDIGFLLQHLLDCVAIGSTHEGESYRAGQQQGHRHRSHDGNGQPSLHAYSPQSSR